MPLLVLDERWISLRAGRRGATRGDAMRCHAKPPTNLCTLFRPDHTSQTPVLATINGLAKLPTPLKDLNTTSNTRQGQRGTRKPEAILYILGSLATHHRRPPEPPPAKTHPISRNAPSMALHERQLKFKTWLPPYSTVPPHHLLGLVRPLFFSICGR